MARNGTRVTILDVAALAGVHAGTVSRALNRPEQVADETRLRVGPRLGISASYRTPRPEA